MIPSPVSGEAKNEKLGGAVWIEGGVVDTAVLGGDKISLQIADFTSDHMNILFRAVEFDSDNLFCFRSNEKFASEEIDFRFS